LDRQLTKLKEGSDVTEKENNPEKVGKILFERIRLRMDLMIKARSDAWDQSTRTCPKYIEWYPAKRYSKYPSKWRTI
jgi:hypothetical protein